LSLLLRRFLITQHGFEFICTARRCPTARRFHARHAREHFLAGAAMPNDVLDLPLLLTADEAAALLRTTRKAIYIMAGRRLLPGATHVGRRVLIRRDHLLHWLDQNRRAPSLKE
jgi:excisionase family DNA binding protein